LNEVIEVAKATAKQLAARAKFTAMVKNKTSKVGKAAAKKGKA
jgi:hypothetical protein